MRTPALLGVLLALLVFKACDASAAEPGRFDAAIQAAATKTDAQLAPTDAPAKVNVGKASILPKGLENRPENVARVVGGCYLSEKTCLATSTLIRDLTREKDARGRELALAKAENKLLKIAVVGLGVVTAGAIYWKVKSKPPDPPIPRD